MQNIRSNLQIKRSKQMWILKCTTIIHMLCTPLNQWGCPWLITIHHLNNSNNLNNTIKHTSPWSSSLIKQALDNHNSQSFPKLIQYKNQSRKNLPLNRLPIIIFKLQWNHHNHNKTSIPKRIRMITMKYEYIFIFIFYFLTTTK